MLPRHLTALRLPVRKAALDLLPAKTSHQKAASIRYVMSAVILPAIKDWMGLCRWHAASFLPERRNTLLVGGTCTG